MTRYFPALDRAITEGETKDALAIISEYGCYIDDDHEMYHHTLERAVHMRNTEVVQALVSAGTDVNAKRRVTGHHCMGRL